MLLKKLELINKYYNYSNNVQASKVVKYTATVLLPKTDFPIHLNTGKTMDRDNSILQECGFSELYHWQRNNVMGKEFTLLDGPPYANGPVHIGHAINKILKDIIIRSQLIQGRRVHFVPGWDCHGLPIEMKASGDSKKLAEPINAVKLRKRARSFARKTVHEQKAAFRSWGIMADWESGVYHTYDADYVISQLQMWWDLYNSGLVYRDLKPVYWSPSSRTALAEAELIYKDNHISNAVILRLRADSSSFNPAPGTLIYLLIWTTTPWTLPVNEAICFSKDIKYSLVNISEMEGLYVVANDSIALLREKFKKEISVVLPLDTAAMPCLNYEHPWRADTLCPVLESGHVTSSGTGLVHTAPAHGHDDFLIGLKHKLSTVSLVNGEGKYTAEAGESLAGLVALDEGTQVVLQKLNNDIVHQEDYTHSYPYDWRTDKPVMIRASQQWFIDTKKLQKSALECLKEVAGPTERLRSLLSSRPYWCVSRQRVWGVPIPAFYHRTSGRPLLSKAIVDRLCQHISKGDADAWWTLPDSQLFPSAACDELFVKPDDVVKGDDIMDIWMDSGLAWWGLAGRTADVCIEGGDQHTGWFQSSLLTSVALRGAAHTRRILTHGFAVDENGRKMSKSIGNVVDPQKVVRNVGVDALRWWVASHAHHSQVPVSDRLVKESREQVTRLRATLRFLLGALHGSTHDDVSRPPTATLDKYILHVCRNTHQVVFDAYNAHAWNVACMNILNFVAGPVSGLYVHVVKDRLYCESAGSAGRVSCCAALAAILQTLVACFAPVLPHLAEEVQLHHPISTDKFWFRADPWSPPESWSQPAVADVLETALAIKAQVDKQAGSTGTAKLECHVVLSSANFNALKMMQHEAESCNSELTELLQVASVRLTEHATPSDEIQLRETARAKCPRCRRYTATPDHALCIRCQHVIAS